MGLFDFFRKTDEPIADPDELRNQLFAAVQVGDLKQLERLARTNQAAIVDQFPTWQKVPDSVRADLRAMQAYVQAMVGVAEFFATRLNRPEPMAALVGNSQENPLTRWQEVLARSRQLIDELRFAEARPLLTESLIESRQMQGTGLDRYLPITHGYLAECFFHEGNAEKAIPHLQQALASCQRSGDAEGVLAYLGSLFEAHRYLGQGEAAASFAERLAELTNGPRWRTRACVAAEGEPLNRIVAVVDGVTMEVDEVEIRDGVRIQFVFERNRIALRPAEAWTQRGNALAHDGQYDEALAAFATAADSDRFDPNSRYLHAFTLLQLGRYAEAADEYRHVEELAPGWFHCRSDLWLAEQLVLGKLQHDHLTALWMLEDGPLSLEEKLAAAQQLVNRCPEWTAAYLQLGKWLGRAQRTSEACTVLRTGLTKDGDSDVRTRMLTELASLLDDRQEQLDLYREAAALNGNLVAAATATLAIRRRTS